MPAWTRATSATWSPTVNTGLSAVIGSWKIMEIRLPRMSRISSSPRVTRSRPSNSIRLPGSILPGGWIRRRIDKRGDGLSAARLADDPYRLPRANVEGDPIDRSRNTALGVERGSQIVD